MTLGTKLSLVLSFFTLKGDEFVELKKPLTFKEQIEKLKSHGMVIEDEEKAKEILSEVNYYRFTGYALQFRIEEADSDYVEALSFEKVHRIYQFDERLRDIFRKYIEVVEVYYRTQISYGFSMAKCIRPPYNQHYDENNFYNKQGYKEVMESFEKERNYYKDSLIVKHHKAKYDSKMPLWVIVELMSFSNTSKLFSSMYKSEKQRIADAVGTSYATLENHLHCLSVLRNKCSHAARLYNTQFNPPARFTSQFLKKHSDMKNNSLFAYVLVLEKRLPDAKMKSMLISDVQAVIEEFQEDIDLSLIGFPEKYIKILKNNVK